MASANSSRFTCTLCNKSYSTNNNLQKHLRSHTGESDQFKCSFCEKRFAYKYLVRDHENVHRGLILYQCTLCKKQFSSNNGLKGHLLRHNTPGKPVQCRTCTARFKVKADLNKHLRRNQKCRKGAPGPKHKYRCIFCGKTFPGYSNLERHITWHNAERPYFCKFCSSCFTDRSGLKHHLMRIHKRGLNKLFKGHFACDVCGKKGFTSNLTLKVHAATHIMERHWKCSYCSKSYKTKYALRRHEKRHGEDKFKCGICSKMFANKFTLTQHIRSHLAEKSYICEICEKAFKTTYSRSYHRRTAHNVHTGERNHSCVFCGMTFSHRSNFLVHIYTHTGERCEECRFCNKQFAQPSGRKKHERKHCKFRIEEQKLGSREK